VNVKRRMIERGRGPNLVRYRRTMGPGRIVIAVAGTSIALGGCFTTSTDYQNHAEEFILTDEDLAAGLGTADDPLVFDSATCEKPADQKAGTTFPCTAIDENGAVWEFSVEIGRDGRDRGANLQPWNHRREGAACTRN